MAARTLALLTALLLVSPAVALSALYEIVEVGMPGSITSSGRGINSSGQVAGGDLNQTSGNAFIYDGAVHDLGNLGGTASWGHAINDQGWVAGFSKTAAFPFTERAFFYDGTMHEVGTLPGGTVSYAYDLNNAGQVVGQATVSEVGQFIYHAFFYDGTLHDLGTLGGSESTAEGVNNNGKVTGTARTADNNSLPFLWDGTTMVPLGNVNGTGMAINDLDHVVGYRNSQDTPSGTTAFIYDGTMHDLGDFEGLLTMPQDINIHDQIVGFAFEPSGSSQEAFFYEQGVGMVDLNDLIDPASGWVLQGANGINDSGQITGYGLYQGQLRGFLLTPVPEPSTFVLVAIGTAALLAVRRRAHVRRTRAN